jgi:hypothetical protein
MMMIEDDVIDDDDDDDDVTGNRTRGSSRGRNHLYVIQTYFLQILAE